MINAVFTQPVWSQLPPTNMGKFVHQPGDNQYSNQTQSERHPVAPPPPPPVMHGPPGGAGPSGYVPVPRQPKPDVSLEPIAADEPVVQPGFPPLPDRLDLPVSTGWASARLGGGGGGYGGPGGGGGYASPAGGGGPSGPPRPSGVHEHYVHYDPTAFIPQSAQQGGSQSSNAGNSQGVAGSRGYYKAQQAPMPGTDRYAMGAGGSREPRLNPNNDQGAAPDAPTPVTLNQTRTQDLSLPDDDFSYKQPPSATNKFMKNLYRRTVQRQAQNLYSMGSSYGSMIRF